MKRIKVSSGAVSPVRKQRSSAARHGCQVDLFEMRTIVDGVLRSTPAHETADFAELVCSNSLKSESENTAPWLLKQEMRRAGSALLSCADSSAVPAGHALAVDRVEFSRLVARAIEQETRITVHREEVNHPRPEPNHHPSHRPADLCPTVHRTRPTHRQWPTRLLRLHQPDRRSRFHRYGARLLRRPLRQRAPPTTSTAPCRKEEYDRFYDALTSAEAVESREWEKLEYFEGCLPIEETARRGRDTLRFGPMKPVGLRDPRTGKTPWAVVQLRCENLRADSYNLVGLQNHLKFGEQARVLRLIPWPGAGKVPALWPNPSQYLHQRAPSAQRDPLIEGSPESHDCRAAFRGGRLHRIDRHRHARRALCGPVGPRRGDPRRAPAYSAGFAGPLHHPCPAG